VAVNETGQASSGACPTPDMDVRLAEYKELKAEQRERIKTRDGLIYTTLLAQAGVLYTTLAGRGGPVLLLALPVLGFVLGWRYLADDRKITEIKLYLRAQHADGAPLFPWERVVTPDIRSRKLIQLVADLLVFVLIPLVGLGWADSLAVVPAWVRVAELTDFFLLGVLFDQWVRGYRATARRERS
jgi:hypothetical protein